MPPDDVGQPPVGRRLLRYPGADYAAPGAYFVTICTAGRRPSLARFADGVVVLAPFGEIVRTAWANIPDVNPAVALDAFILMPDHLHGIVMLGSSPASELDGGNADLPSLGTVVGGFKRAAAVEARRHGIAGPEPVWQRGYHDRIVRNDRELAAIREYIAANPARWLAARDSG